MRVRIQAWRYAYNVALAISEKLADLGVLVLRNHGSTYRARPGDILINYGKPDTHLCVPGVKVLNHPNAVAARYTKLQQYKLLEAAGAPAVRYTTNKRVVREWLNEGYDVFARLHGNSTGGHGIRLLDSANPGVDIPDATVYTRRFRARREYRVHVFNGRVIDVSQKRKSDTAEGNAVRSYANGYVYCHTAVEPYPLAMTDAAIAAVAACKLDFGAVDILCMDNGNVAVLEVNSAPGMEGTTLDNWTQALREWILAQEAA